MLDKQTAGESTSPAATIQVTILRDERFGWLLELELIEVITANLPVRSRLYMPVRIDVIALVKVTLNTRFLIAIVPVAASWRNVLRIACYASGKFLGVTAGPL